VLQFVSACALGCSSFYFAKRWHFVCRFSVRLLSVVSSFRVAGNGCMGDVAAGVGFAGGAFAAMCDHALLAGY